MIQCKYFETWGLRNLEQKIPRKRLGILGGGVQGKDGAEVHRVHVVGGASQDLLNNKPVSPLRWMEWIPKCIDVSVRAQVGERRAKPKPIVWSLPTTCYL